MLTFDHKIKPTRREKVLEMHIDRLQERIRELEQKPRLEKAWKIKEQIPTTNLNYAVLPVTYTSVEEQTPTLEIVSCPSIYQSDSSLIQIQKMKTLAYETVV